MSVCMSVLCDSHEECGCWGDPIEGAGGEEDPPSHSPSLPGGNRLSKTTVGRQKAALNNFWLMASGHNKKINKENILFPNAEGTG